VGWASGGIGGGGRAGGAVDPAAEVLDGPLEIQDGERAHLVHRLVLAPGAEAKGHTFHSHNHNGGISAAPGKSGENNNFNWDYNKIGVKIIVR